MRRSQFVRAGAALTLVGSLPLAGRASGPAIRMMIPANPGGGWDTTGRALGRALVESGGAETVQYDNKGGAAGALGLAQFAQGSKGDPRALMMMGAVMVGGLITARPPVQLQSCTPLARLTSEYNVFVVPANSPLRSMKDVVEQLRRDPASVRWGGGSRGATEHIAACMLARSAGVDPKKVNYIAFRGGGEAVSAVLGGNVTVGGSGYSEFAEHIAAGTMRAIGVTSQKRLPGLAIPTLKELGWDVVIGNWRGVYGAPGITAGQHGALTDMVVKATKTKSWQDALAKNGWTPALETGKAFEDFVEYEFSSLRAIMYLSGML
jgi:putative tricarboxylic transport membrane protein